MRVALVSPPTMHPTSPPLGPAALSAFLRSSDPGLEVRCFDLNLSFYRILLRLIEEEKFSIRIYGWSEKKSRIRLLEAVSVISDSDWPRGDLTRYHSAASIFLSFENIFNGFMAEMARRLCLDLEVPARVGLFFRELMQPVMDFEPELFGVSVQFGHQLEFAALLLKLCKEQLEIPTVMGGAWSGVAPHPEELLSHPTTFAVEGKGHPFSMSAHLDYLIPGEGETALLELCHMLQGQRDATQVANLIYLDRDTIHKNQPSVIMDLSSLPVPDFSSFQLADYFVPRPVLPLQLSRGCPWARCAFCTHHHSYLCFRQLPVSHCISTLSLLTKRYQCSSFSFVDEMILPGRFRELAEAMVAEDLLLNYAAYAKPSEKFSSALLQTLKSSGCRVLMWGLESANQRVLDLMAKGTRVQTVEKVIHRAADAGISNLLFVLFGFPTETEEEFLNTVSFLQEHRCHIHALSMGTFVLTEGSEVQRRPENFSIVPGEQTPDPANRLLQYETTEGMSPETVERLYREYLPELEKIGLSRRLAGYRDHLLLWVAENTVSRPVKNK